MTTLADFNAVNDMITGLHTQLSNHPESHPLFLVYTNIRALSCLLSHACNFLNSSAASVNFWNADRYGSHRLMVIGIAIDLINDLTTTLSPKPFYHFFDRSSLTSDEQVYLIDLPPFKNLKETCYQFYGLAKRITNSFDLIRDKLEQSEEKLTSLQKNNKKPPTIEAYPKLNKFLGDCLPSVANYHNPNAYSTLCMKMLEILTPGNITGVTYELIERGWFKYYIAIKATIHRGMQEGFDFSQIPPQLEQINKVIMSNISFEQLKLLMKIALQDDTLHPRQKYTIEFTSIFFESIIGPYKAYIKLEILEQLKMYIREESYKEFLPLDPHENQARIDRINTLATLY
ncbi:MAG: hypothetical protein KBD37_05585 [Burkholderiales bacterium]|nr:hypothetical protein [Burkholderiales bacterium]